MLCYCFSRAVLISFTNMFPNTIFSVLTVTTVFSSPKLSSTKLPPETVCPAKSSWFASPLGT